MAVATLILAGSGVAVASTTTQAVGCTYDGATLSCPIPQTTVTNTVTSTPAPVTVAGPTTTVPVTLLSTVTAPAVTVTKTTAKGTATVTATATVAKTVTAAATTSPPAAAPTPTTAAPTSSAASSSAAPAAAGFPDASNTGVPAGTKLAAYTGACTITSAITITNADVAAHCGELILQSKGIVITGSNLPRLDSTYQDGGSGVTVSDSTISSPTWEEGVLWGYNITATRVNVTGGQHSVHCNTNCTIVDSYLHDQYNPDGQGFHNNAFISNGGTSMVIRHNTLACTAILNATNGGCSGDLSLFGDFDPITNVTIDGNLFKANASSISYCLFGGYQPAKAYPVATGVKVTNNVFERGTNGKCGVYGPATSFQSSATGNVWTNNLWDDGTPVIPS